MLTPTQDLRRTQIRSSRELPRGLDAMVDLWVGRYQRRASLTGELLAEAGVADGLAGTFSGMPDAVLRQRLLDYRELFLRSASPPPEVLRHALAAIREAARRTLGLYPYAVQLAGTLALFRGYLAEMATGEGKTLSAGMAAVLAGWSGKPCHVVTVNDYLARRDAEWMRPLFAYSGIRAGFVTGDMNPAERTRGYAHEVTYCTGKEIVADFLRDRLRLGRFQSAGRRQVLLLLQPRLRQLPGVVMRGIHTAIVDEADSVMIDEAITPVIIASPKPNEPLKEACRMARQIALEFIPDHDYRIHEKYREIELSAAGQAKLASVAERLPGLWRGPERRKEIVIQALTARELFQEGRHYTVRSGRVQLVDEFTGRIMQQRSLRAGLHQAIEIKEGVEITDPTETLARLSFQRFFRFFGKLSGMTGTASEAAAEFWRVYRLPVVTIPPNRPSRRVDYPDCIFPDPADKWKAVIDDVRARHARGQPVLIGTRSIAISELLSSKLTEMELPHRLLNALRDREEATIVAGAGEFGQITIATNMAGRGTDIKLGAGVVEVGGLHVISTDRHESRRVDRQLYGRSGRQGDPGSARTFISLEDDLFKRYIPDLVTDRLRLMMTNHRPGSVFLAQSLLERAQHSAQVMAYKQRLGVLAMDTWMENSLSFAGIEHG